MLVVFIITINSIKFTFCILKIVLQHFIKLLCNFSYRPNTGSHKSEISATHCIKDQSHNESREVFSPLEQTIWNFPILLHRAALDLF